MTLGNITGAIPITVHEPDGPVAAGRVVRGAKAAWLDEQARRLPAAVWMKQWPFAHTIEMTTGSSERLEVRTKVVNLSTEPMPVALGYHPWFQLTDSPREEWSVTVPARTRWLLSYQRCDGRDRATDALFRASRAR